LDCRGRSRPDGDDRPRVDTIRTASKVGCPPGGGGSAGISDPTGTPSNAWDRSPNGGFDSGSLPSGADTKTPVLRVLRPLAPFPSGNTRHREVAVRSLRGELTPELAAARASTRGPGH